ncbi:MAG: hypothetical protein LBR45_02920 [Bacteroidales bacterium]|jgi:hypothetical protein|nr:hypothetical protein [Bacteroidales bacterium]
MNKERQIFAMTLFNKIPHLVSLIEKNFSLDFRQAMRLLYNSTLFSDLENEKTKVWHFSEILLLDLLEQEINTGKINYPDV